MNDQGSLHADLDVSCPYVIFNARRVSIIHFIASDPKILEYFNFHLPSYFCVILKICK